MNQSINPAENAGKYALEVSGLSRSFGNKKAVDGVSFRVEEGSLFSLLGVNGAGKTTTIRMITGLLKPDAGTALVSGFPAGSARAKSVIGLSPQETSTAGNLTVRENLLFAARLRGAEHPGETADWIAERLGLTECIGTLSKNLSGGFRRRLSIGMGLAGSPKVLFLDEPTLGLDVLARRELWKLIRELKTEMTVLLTTHYMEEAEQLSDRIGIMAGGRLVECGTLEELRRAAGVSVGEGLEEIFVRLAAV